jgi:hypothetical protein
VLNELNDRNEISNLIHSNNLIHFEFCLQGCAGAADCARYARCAVRSTLSAECVCVVELVFPRRVAVLPSTGTII